jgi:hypothetical protein
MKRSGPRLTNVLNMKMCTDFEITYGGYQSKTLTRLSQIVGNHSSCVQQMNEVEGAQSVIPRMSAADATFQTIERSLKTCQIIFTFALTGKSRSLSSISRI